MTVNQEIENLGFKVISIKQGMVELVAAIDNNDCDSIKRRLEDIGFELLSDEKSKLISEMKAEIIEVIHDGKTASENMKYSEYLSGKLGHDDSYLCNLFSSTEGISIEKFVILQKVERAKELLVYDGFSCKEIAVQLNFKSTKDMSNQFKNITGLSPKHFKKVKQHKQDSSEKYCNQK